jgi:hypothetical protein
MNGGFERGGGTYNCRLDFNFVDGTGARFHAPPRTRALKVLYNIKAEGVSPHKFGGVVAWKVANDQFGVCFCLVSCKSKFCVNQVVSREIDFFDFAFQVPQLVARCWLKKRMCEGMWSKPRKGYEEGEGDN